MRLSITASDCSPRTRRRLSQASSCIATQSLGVPLERRGRLRRGLRGVRDLRRRERHGDGLLLRALPRRRSHLAVRAPSRGSACPWWWLADPGPRRAPRPARSPRRAATPAQLPPPPSRLPRLEDLEERLHRRVLAPPGVTERPRATARSRHAGGAWVATGPARAPRGGRGRSCQRSSERALVFPSLLCSGAMYAGVCRTRAPVRPSERRTTGRRAHEPVFDGLGGGLSPVRREDPPRKRSAMPKSATRTRPSSPTSTLSGLKSRWTIPSACAAASPLTGLDAARREWRASRAARGRASLAERAPP